MLDPKTSRFWKSAVQSGLLDARQLVECWESIPLEKRDDEEHVDRRLGRQAVHLGMLTLWQAQQLLAGRVVGFKVDRYILLELIGQGGMGRVYRARDTRLNRVVALKILSPERMNNPRAVARFQREARVGAQLQHENLVRLYDFGESQGRHYLVMEFIEGRTLGFYIATQGRIPSVDAANFGRQVALGLDHAHAKGLIHRDVNPFNVIVTKEGVAKLADMGLAIDRADEGRVTRDGATVGTFDYVAPEQARHSHSADIRSDIYSLGCTLYHMLTGQVPYPHPSLAEKLFAHQSQEPPAVESVGAEVPRGFAEVIRKMMKKLPEERYQHPQDVIAALGQFAGKASREQEPVLAYHGTATGGKVDFGGLSSTSPTSSTTDGNVQPLDSSTEFSINLDLGPTPLLSASGRPAKSWFKGTTPRSGSNSGSEGGLSNASGSAELGLRHGIVRWVAGGLAALLIVGMVALLPSLRKSRTDKPLESQDSSVATPTPKNRPNGLPGLAWGDSIVGVLDRSGVLETTPDLFRAMEIAVGGKGTVVLRGGVPHEYKVGDGHVLNGRGMLKIQGEDAATVLRIDLDGGKPFLSTGSRVELVLSDLTFEARRSNAPSGAAAVPLIQAGGKIAVDHCAFRTEPTRGFVYSCALSTAGGPLTVSSCWFEGFDVALDINSLAGIEHNVSDSMFVPGGTPAEAAKAGLPVRRGWAGKIRYLGGGAANASRSVIVDHCTFAGEGVFQVVNFTDHGPIRLSFSSCVARVGKLLRWEVDAGAGWDSKALVWTGTDNQLDVVDTWIDGDSSIPSVAGLEEWTKVASEKTTIREGVQFAMGSESPEGRLLPAAYSLLHPSLPTPGADADVVGPGR